jgi:hypothetical protein
MVILIRCNTANAIAPHELRLIKLGQHAIEWQIKSKVGVAEPILIQDVHYNITVLPRNHD